MPYLRQRSLIGIPTSASFKIATIWLSVFRLLIVKLLSFSLKEILRVICIILRGSYTTILAGRNRTPATEIELAVKLVIETGGKDSIASLLSSLERCPNTRTFRKSAFSALKNAVSLSISDPSKTIMMSAEIIREQRRHQGDRRIPQRAIG